MTSSTDAGTVGLVSFGAAVVAVVVVEAPGVPVGAASEVVIRVLVVAGKSVVSTAPAPAAVGAVVEEDVGCAVSEEVGSEVVL